MNSPYMPPANEVANVNSKSRLAIDLGLMALLFITWLMIVYAVSLIGSSLLTKDIPLIVLSPFIPGQLLVAVLISESGWIQLVGLMALPLAVAFIGKVFGVRKRRAWVIVISLGILYGLFLRLFYQLVSIA